jgi:TM2 domain-containing membrane protein YozV
MNRAKKVIALTIALTGGLWVYSYASPGDAQTYVSKSGLMNPDAEQSSGLVFAQRLQDSGKVEIPDSTEPQEASTTEAKEPYKAFLYALVPGAVVRGAGHLYAGKTGTGAVLLGSELAGATLLYVSLGMSAGSRTVTAEAFPVAFAGVALFLGSWIYDMGGAPLAVQKENQRLLQGNRPHLKLRTGPDEVRLVVVYYLR